MMRFNQAWMLDGLNNEVYWGFGNLLGIQGKFKESIPLFKKSIKINSKNSRVWNELATSYGNLFVQTKNKEFFNSSIGAIKNTIAIDPKNSSFYAQLTAAYAYYVQKDSARKYLRITEKMDPNAVNPQVRRMLSGN